jgi:hypothetical protein
MRNAKENFELQSQYEKEKQENKIKATEEIFNYIDSNLKECDDKKYLLNFEIIKIRIREKYLILLDENTSYSNILDAFLQEYSAYGYGYRTRQCTNPSFLIIYAVKL